MPRLAALFALLLAAGPAAAGLLRFAALPPFETLADSAVTLRLIPEGDTALDSCGVYSARVPGSGFAGRQRLAQVEVGKTDPAPARLRLSFKPAAGEKAPQLALGVHYLVAACGNGASLSPEFPLRVVTKKSPSLLSPKSVETSSRPEIAWTPVPGVPAYHLLLSDQPLRIDSSGVSGASVIWQAIVPASTSRILYGDPDPSGNFYLAPPPLVPGVEYNLGVLNNYDGKTALHTSGQAQALRLFTVQSAGAPPAPRVLEPARGTVFRAPQDSVIRFRWTRSAGAQTYRLFLYAPEIQEGVEVLRPVWQSEGTDTLSALRPRGALLKGRYLRKVFALAAGAAGVSDTASFTYDSETQALRLGARARGPGGDTLRLAGVRIAVQPLDGAGESLPLYSLASGLLERAFALGSYRLSFTAEGYEPAAVEAVLVGGSPMPVDPLLAASPSRVTGRIVDSLGAPLGNVEVTAGAAAARSDAAGYFLAGVAAGPLRAAFRKEDYLDRDTAFTAEAGKTHALGSVALRKAPGLLSGAVRTPGGAAVVSATVEAADSAGRSRKTLTDKDGRFSLFLARGDYRVTAARAGYSGTPQTVRLREAAEVALMLKPGASVVKGRVLQASLRAGGELRAPLEGATVSLRGASGAPGTARTDVNGAFSLSAADTGSYWLKAEHPGAYPDSLRIRVATPASTSESELRLLRYASVAGRIRFQPDTAVDPASIRVALLPPAGGTAMAAGFAASDSGGVPAFSLERVPEGSWRLTAGLPGFAPLAEPLLALARGQRLDTALTLRRVDGRAAFRFRRGGGDLPGTVRLRAPLAEVFPAGEKRPLEGTVVLDAVPASVHVLPLTGYALQIPGTPGLDTVIDLAFPALRDTGISLAAGRVSVPYRLDENADAGQLAYSAAPGIWDTLRLASAGLRAGAATAMVPLPPQGGKLELAFTFRFGARFYGGPASAFSVTAPRDTGLGELLLAEGDSLVLPAGGRCRVTLRPRSAAGDALDSALAVRGEVRFRLPAGFPATVEETQGLSAVLRAGAARKAAAWKLASREGWDTLEVVATYGGRTLTDRFPIRVAALIPNALRLSSLVGENADLPSPQAVALRVTAYDTTTSPPTPLVANPQFLLSPPEAGRVEGGTLVLDSNFLGPVRVFARHARPDGKWLEAELFGERDSAQRGLQVGQTLREAGGRFFHHGGLEIASPSGALPAGTRLGLRPRPLSRTFSSLPGSSLEGPAYELTLSPPATPEKPVEIRLSPPPARAKGNSFIRRFDAVRLRWEDPADTGSGSANAFGRPYAWAEVEDFDGQYYGLFTASGPLGLSEFQVVPNPFSPGITAMRDGNTLPGARIRFRPEADSASAVTVSLRVYTMAGEPVRALIDHKTFPKTDVEIYWDGLDARGRPVRNGRYLLAATVTPTGGGRTKTLLRPVVVFR